MFLDDADTLDFSRGSDAGQASNPEDSSNHGCPCHCVGKAGRGCQSHCDWEFFFKMSVARTRANPVVAEFARMFAKFSLSAGARTNCVGHLLRAVSDSNHE